jgi:hypothetical protein
MKASQESAVKQERVATQTARTAGPKSLVSDETMSKEEPIQSGGMDWSGKLKDAPVPSMTSGQHHGRVSAIADAVGHSIASIAEGKEKHSRYGAAYQHMDTAYAHLSMHHTYNLQGQHDKAAASLAKAADSIKAASKTVSKQLDKTGVTNAFGETRRRGDLDATLDHTVLNYATTHGVGTKAQLPTPEKRVVQDAPSGGATKFSSAGRGLRDFDAPISGVPTTIPTRDTGRSSALDRLSERGIGKLEKKTTPRVRTAATPKPVDKDAVEYHVHGAILGLGTRGTIPLHHATELTDNQIDMVHKFVDSKSPAELRPHLQKSQDVVSKYQKRMYK